MADRKLAFNELQKLFEAHGCTFHFNPKTQIITITRGVGDNYGRWSQHAHKGRSDSFEKYILKTARRRLGFADMSDEDFYAPLD